jgi:hypothetical protein
MFGKKKAAAAPPPAVAKQASFKKVAEKDLSVREEKEEEDFEEADNVWTTASWLRSQNLHKTIAAALKPDKPGMEQYDFMSKHLTDADLKKRLEAASRRRRRASHSPTSSPPTATRTRAKWASRRSTSSLAASRGWSARR